MKKEMRTAVECATNRGEPRGRPPKEKKSLVTVSKHSQHKDKGSQKVNISMIFIVHETKYGRFKMSY